MRWKKKNRTLILKTLPLRRRNGEHANPRGIRAHESLTHTSAHRRKTHDDTVRLVADICLRTIVSWTIGCHGPMKNWFRKAQLLPRRGTSFERRIIIIEMNYFEKKMKKRLGKSLYRRAYSWNSLVRNSEIALYCEYIYIILLEKFRKNKRVKHLIAEVHGPLETYPRNKRSRAIVPHD